jgi:sulfonate transport system ATP-binding protein
MSMIESIAPTVHYTSYGASLNLQQLSKVFGKTQVLNNVNLKVAPSEFIAIAGRSGCGKSTLLRLIAGLEAPTAGEVRINDELLQELNVLARIMFQDARLLPWRNVLDNVGLGLRQQTSQRAQWALQQVGLGDRAKDWVTVLSGGQRQRVALARALVSQPRLLLLDEPLSALDALTRIEMQQLIQTLWQEQQFTAVLVTHDVEEAVFLADRVIVLENGAVVLDLPIPFPRPRDRSNRSFVQLKAQVLDQILRVT